MIVKHNSFRRKEVVSHAAFTYWERLPLAFVTNWVSMRAETELNLEEIFGFNACARKKETRLSRGEN